MATNFHADLPNDQIHPPKDFETAPSSSVLTKNHENSLEWNDSPFDLSSTITCGNDVAGGLHGQSFYVNWSKTLKFEVYYSVSGDTTPFTGTVGYTLAKVDIAPNDTAITVAAATKTEVDRQSTLTAANFTTTLNGTGKITISGMSDCGDSQDQTTGFLITNTSTPKTGTRYLSSAAGVLDWNTVDSSFEQIFYGHGADFRLAEYLFIDITRMGLIHSKSIGAALAALGADVAINSNPYITKAGETFGGAHGDVIGTAGLTLKIGFVKHSVNCDGALSTNGTDLGSATIVCTGTVNCYTVPANASVAMNTHDMITCYILGTGKVDRPTFTYNHKLIINK